MSDAVYWITYVVTFTKLNVKVDLIESRVSRGNNLLRQISADVRPRLRYCGAFQN
jgi:hypothetical protein